MALKSLHVVLLGVAAVSLAQAADYVKPNVKPGLWEVTNQPKITGDLPISDEQMAKLTPEQKARLDAVMAKRNSPKTYKECMTPEKIAKFEMNPHGDEATGCTRNIVSSTASELTLHDECKRGDHQSVSDVHYEIKSGGTVMTGKVNVVATSATGKTMKVDSTIMGKWIAADCGSVKDPELEK